MPGSVVVNDVPLGTMIIVHSALAHARRPKAGFGTPRYFANVGYCSGRAATKWPAYSSIAEMLLINQSALEHGHAREDHVGGSMAFLFDHERVFADTDEKPWGPYGPLRLPPGTESEDVARRRWDPEG